MGMGVREIRKRNHLNTRENFETGISTLLFIIRLRLQLIKNFFV